MRVLLDTHVWIWWLTGQAELPAAERTALDRLAARQPPLLSAISLWEAQLLASKGRLQLTLPFSRWLVAASSPEVVEIVPLSTEVVLRLDHLPARFHGDPADRIIVASAQAREVALHSHDRAIRRAKVVGMWRPPA